MGDQLGIQHYSSSIVADNADNTKNHFGPSYTPFLREVRTPLLFSEAERKLWEYTGFKPHKQQVLSLLRLYYEGDHILIGPTGWGKTLVIIGLSILLPPSYVIIIVSPLKAI